MILPIPGGYVLIARHIFESPIWRDDPNLLKLWIYLFCKARSRPEPKKYNGFEIKRGELVTSLSIIADENEYLDHGRLKKWSRQQVARMLEKLAKGRDGEPDSAYIEIKADTYGTHIRIINYDTYQDPKNYKSDSRETAAEQPSDSRDTGSGQAADINKAVNTGNTENKDNIFVPETPKGPPTPPPPPPEPPRPPALREDLLASIPQEYHRLLSTDRDGTSYLETKSGKSRGKLHGKRLIAFFQFWETFNYKKAMREAASAWQQLPPLLNGDLEKILAGAKREADSRPDIIAAGRTPKMAQGWISGRRWEDEVLPNDKPQPKWPEYY